MSVLTPVQRAHLMLYSQTFSPDGSYLSVGSNFGNVALFNITNISNNYLSSSKRSESIIWNIHSDSGGSYSVTGNEQFLFSGGLGEISAVDWSEVRQSNAAKHLPKIAFKLKIPRRDSFSIPEVNSLCANADADTIYAGCGDNNIHSFDLSTGKLVATISKHKGYVHSVSRAGENELLSCCDSGMVYIWDLRHSTAREVQRFVPAEEPDLARPYLGAWITTAQSERDWIVCGGGPRLAVWNRKVMKYTSILEPQENRNSWSPYSVRFHGDKILSGGNAAELYHWFIDGTLTASVPTTCSHILNIAMPGEASQTDKVFVCGSSKTVDVFAGIGYQMAKLHV